MVSFEYVSWDEVKLPACFDGLQIDPLRVQSIVICTIIMLTCLCKDDPLYPTFI